MVERGEDVEKYATENIVDQRFKKIVELTDKSISEFGSTIEKCDLYESLKAYMNVEHFLQEGKRSALEILNLDAEKGNRALEEIKALEQKAYRTAEEKAKNCGCQPKEPFRYVTELPKE
jgi:hypothetical protein